MWWCRTVNIPNAGHDCTSSREQSIDTVAPGLWPAGWEKPTPARRGDGVGASVSHVDAAAPPFDTTLVPWFYFLYVSLEMTPWRKPFTCYYMNKLAIMLLNLRSEKCSSTDQGFWDFEQDWFHVASTPTHLLHLAACIWGDFFSHLQLNFSMLQPLKTSLLISVYGILEFYYSSNVILPRSVATLRSSLSLSGKIANLFLQDVLPKCQVYEHS